MSAPDVAAMQSVLLRMREDAQGRELLGRLNVDGFEPGTLALYDGVLAMSRLVDAT